MNTQLPDGWEPVWGEKSWHQKCDPNNKTLDKATVRHFESGKLFPGSPAGWFAWAQGASDEEWQGPFRTMKEAMQKADEGVEE